MIVDASVAFKWIFVEDGSDAAKALIGRDDLIAPTLLLAEIGNALWKKVARRQIDDATALAPQLSIVASLVTTVDEGEVMERALQFALLLAHPIYDCIYLAVAEQRRDTLVTADVRFAKKVAAHDFGHLVKILDSIPHG